MNQINYITNIPVSETSGGMSGINFSTFSQLNKKLDINEYIFINPKVNKVSKFLSNAHTMLNLKCNYHFFSEGRLEKFKEEFEKNKVIPDAYFFHGFTPWIKTKPCKPYFCFNDACFETYVSLYNNRNRFSEKDLSRIFNQEAQWLTNASKVFFQSDWALEETKKLYGLQGLNFEKVGVGGFVEIPENDYYKDEFNFLFIAREFMPKGGLVAANAFQRVNSKYPQSKLWIIGEKPPKSVLGLPGIIYQGFLSKEIENENQELKDFFRNAFALIHPTKKDINPLVISELGYFGCPAISSNSFAIPEYVIDGVTGFLMNNPNNINELEEKMLYLIENQSEYKNMRKRARYFSVENNTWDKVGDKLVNSITSALDL